MTSSIARVLSCLTVAGVLMLSGVAPLSADQEEGPVETASTAVSFAPFLPGSTKFGKLEWRGGIVISSDDERFGGYSGLVLSEDGSSLVAVSDRGWWLTADLTYENGHLVSIENARTARLLGPNGRVITENHAKDAEGLTIYDGPGLDGRLLVGLERWERLLLYNFGRDGFAARPKAFGLPRAIRRAKFNRELEAVGRFPKGTRLAGTVIVFSERFLDAKGNIRGWLMSGRGTSPLSIVRSDDYDVTDLAVLPDGDVLFLERRFNALKLAGMRIRRVASEDIGANATVDGEVVLEANQPLKAVDNMEGMAVHRSPDGELRITLISDDNFNPIQSNLLLQFALPSKPEGEPDQ